MASTHWVKSTMTRKWLAILPRIQQIIYETRIVLNAYILNIPLVPCKPHWNIKKNRMDGQTDGLIFNPIKDLDPKDIYIRNFLNPIKIKIGSGNGLVLWGHKPCWPELPACTTASRTAVATITTNSSTNLKFVWLNPTWWYWVLTMLQDRTIEIQMSNLICWASYGEKLSVLVAK